jgi:hypothetical protein
MSRTYKRPIVNGIYDRKPWKKHRILQFFYADEEWEQFLKWKKINAPKEKAFIRVVRHWWTDWRGRSPSSTYRRIRNRIIRAKMNQEIKDFLAHHDDDLYLKTQYMPTIKGWI